MQKIKFIVFEQVCLLKKQSCQSVFKRDINKWWPDWHFDEIFLFFITPNEPLTPCKKLSLLLFNKYAYSKNNHFSKVILKKTMLEFSSTSQKLVKWIHSMEYFFKIKKYFRFRQRTIMSNIYLNDFTPPPSFFTPSPLYQVNIFPLLWMEGWFFSESSWHW